MSGKRFAFDFHVHTAYSFDSVTPPRVAIEIARRRGLDGIAVTDHDTIEGARAAMRANPYSDFLIIPGIEVKSDAGDVIGLFLREQIHSKRLPDVIDEIHSQGGIVYMPHPVRTFGSHAVPQLCAEHEDVELWERHNGRYDQDEFESADEIFGRLPEKRCLCGSDAHFPWEIGLLRAVFDELPVDPQALLRASRNAALSGGVRAEIPRRIGITMGAMIKDCKRRRYARVGALAASLPWKFAKRSMRVLQGLRH